jgi:hypothetical protein
MPPVPTLACFTLACLHSLMFLSIFSRLTLFFQVNLFYNWGVGSKYFEIYIHEYIYILSLHSIKNLVRNSFWETIFLQSFENCAHLISVIVVWENHSHSDSRSFALVPHCFSFRRFTDSLVSRVRKFLNDVYVLWCRSIFLIYMRLWVSTSYQKHALLSGGNFYQPFFFLSILFVFFL